eukprot:1930062-Pleurochrysis_carterae.AAC.1
MFRTTKYVTIYIICPRQEGRQLFKYAGPQDQARPRAGRSVSAARLADGVPAREDERHDEVAPRVVVRLAQRDLRQTDRCARGIGHTRMRT